MKLNVSLDVWIGYCNVRIRHPQLMATADLFKTAEETGKVAIGSYQSGSIVDGLNAQTVLATARQLCSNSHRGWKGARAQFAFALGRFSSAAPLADSA